MKINKNRFVFGCIIGFFAIVTTYVFVLQADIVWNKQVADGLVTRHSWQRGTKCVHFRFVFAGDSRVGEDCGTLVHTFASRPEVDEIIKVAFSTASGESALNAWLLGSFFERLFTTVVLWLVTFESFRPRRKTS